MTLDELSKLTPEQKRVKIEEACPKVIRSVTNGADGYAKPHWQWFDGKNWNPCHNNDPLSDLNAMNEAEKVLMSTDPNPSSRPQDHPPLLYYISLMHIVCGHKGNYLPFDYFRCATATAAQRADAFLLTI